MYNQLGLDERRMKAYERSNRIVIKGKPVLEHHLVNRGRSCNNEKRKHRIDNDDYYMLFYD